MKTEPRYIGPWNKRQRQWTQNCLTYCEEYLVYSITQPASEVVECEKCSCFHDDLDHNICCNCGFTVPRKDTIHD